MDKQKIRQQLVLKRVESRHLDQFNELLRYVFQVTNEDLILGGYEEGEFARSKRPFLERTDTFGWFNGERLISQICITPYTMNIHGRACNMGGVTGVGTYPEYAGMGLINDLMSLALEQMRQNGQWISCLYPYSIPFYRHKGWEIMSDRVAFTFRDDQLPKRQEVPGFVERAAVDHPDVLATYDRYAPRTHGALFRGRYEWEEYWRWENEEDRSAAIYYDEHHVPSGYIIYWIHHDVFHIKEMIYLDSEARRGLWNFISAHLSMLDEVKGYIHKNEPLAFYLEDSRITETIEPYFMARIIDVARFLESFPFTREARGLCFEVSDPVSEWNNGLFLIADTADGANTIVRGASASRVNVDIRTLTSLLMNYRRPSYFAELDKLRAAPETIALLEALIPDQKPWFADYF